MSLEKVQTPDKTLFCYACLTPFKGNDYHIKVHGDYNKFHRFHIPCYGVRGRRRPQCLRYIVDQQMSEGLPLEINRQLFDLYPKAVPWEQRPFLTLPKEIGRIPESVLKYVATIIKKIR